MKTPLTAEEYKTVQTPSRTIFTPNSIPAQQTIDITAKQQNEILYLENSTA